jgi:hypothetical protein
MKYNLRQVGRRIRKAHRMQLSYMPIFVSLPNRGGNFSEFIPFADSYITYRICVWTLEWLRLKVIAEVVKPFVNCPIIE